MGKGKIARYKQFLLFPQCFQKACFQEASKGVIVWEWVKVLFTTTVAFIASVYQDHAAQNMQPDFFYLNCLFFCNTIDKSNNEIAIIRVTILG